MYTEISIIIQQMRPWDLWCSTSEYRQLTWWHLKLYICITGVISKIAKSEGEPILAPSPYRPDVLMF